MGLRPEAVSGLFYPGLPAQLSCEVDRLLADVPVGGAVPRVLIVPHAGYPYSGACAAVGYKRLIGRHYARVLLVGPSHRVSFEGGAFSPDAQWRTPLGSLSVDRVAIDRFLAHHASGFFVHEQPHGAEHAIEVQLPFLQRVLEPGFEIVPLTYGRIEPHKILTAIEALVDEQTLTVISSDLSHFHDLSWANTLDRTCHEGVLALSDLGICEACGRLGMEASILYAKAHDLKPRLLHYSTSYEATRDRNRVVGYGCYGFFE